MWSHRDRGRELEEPKKNLKYKLSVVRLNAVNYAVPQFRDRIFLIGARNGRSVKEISVYELSIIGKERFIGSNSKNE